jgi:parvulin-like peptidyl-prolyl isomerase
MKDFSDVTIGSVGETRISLDDLFFELKTDLDQHVIDNVVHTILLRKVAEDLGLSVSDAELQDAADKFRMNSGLISASETNEWMEDNSLSIEEFEKKLENDLLKTKVEEKLATQEKINKTFAENILDFEKVNIAKIVVNDQGLAGEIKTQLDEGEADFATLASKYSADTESASKGGFVGFVNRQDLPDEVDVAVFADDAPEIIGPVESKGGYYIIKIIEPKKVDPEDDQTKSIIVKVIFEEYMNEKAAGLNTKLDFIE